MEVYGYLPLYGTSAVDADVDSKHSLLRKYTKVLGISTADGIRGSPGWVSGLCVDYLTLPYLTLGDLPRCPVSNMASKFQPTDVCKGMGFHSESRLFASAARLGKVVAVAADVGCAELLHQAGANQTGERESMVGTRGRRVELCWLRHDVSLEEASRQDTRKGAKGGASPFSRLLPGSHLLLVLLQVVQVLVQVLVLVSNSGFRCQLSAFRLLFCCSAGVLFWCIRTLREGSPVRLLGVGVLPDVSRTPAPASVQRIAHSISRHCSIGLARLLLPAPNLTPGVPPASCLSSSSCPPALVSRSVAPVCATLPTSRPSNRRPHISCLSDPLPTVAFAWNSFTPLGQSRLPASRASRASSIHPS